MGLWKAVKALLVENDLKNVRLALQILNVVLYQKRVDVIMVDRECGTTLEFLQLTPDDDILEQ